MKIIFLDIDGVLNGKCFFEDTKKDREGITREDEVTFWCAMLDPEAIKTLNSVIEKTGAKVVLSSSWRIYHTLSAMRRYLRSKGFVGELIDKTPRASASPYRRGNEIQTWLSAHPEVEKFVIIDDDSDMEHLMSKLVKTNWDTGLLPEHVNAIVEHLT